jgi:hypothetical protein
MRTLRIIMTFITWIGIFFIILGIFGIMQNAYYMIKSFLHPDWPPIMMPIYWGSLFYVFGVILASIGGFLSRPRYVWPFLVICGAVTFVISCIMEITVIRTVVRLPLFILVFSLLGIICICVGLLIRWLRRRYSPKMDFQV